MLVAEALNTDTRVLLTSDTLRDALEQMDAMQVNLLPVINHATQEVLGQIRRETLLQSDIDSDDAIVLLDLDKATVIFSSQHLFHAVRLMLQHELMLLPVVNEEWIYQGVIQKHQVLELLGQMLNLTEYGSVITIELDQNNFTISEIVQLIETEGGKILGITVEAPTSERHTYEVSVKLNLQDVSRVASSLRRYGYTILTETKSESNNIDLETRADEFLKYLDM